MTMNHTLSSQATEGQAVLFKRKSCVHGDEMDAPCCPLK